MKSGISSLPIYTPISTLGSGSFGTVIEAYDQTNDMRVAIKRTHKVTEELSREYEILEELKNCKFIVKLLNTFYTEDSKGKCIQNLVFEYIPQSLENLIKSFRDKNESIPIEKIKKIRQYFLNGNNQVHKLFPGHHDIKPDNILIS